MCFSSVQCPLNEGNGIPVVQIELKTLGISPRRAMEQIVDYKKDLGNGYTSTLADGPHPDGGVRIFPRLRDGRGVGVLLGVASTFWKNTAGSIVQTSVAEEMRGRVMSVFGIGAQMLALGWLLGGAMSKVVGNQATLVIAGGLMAALNIYVYTRAPQMRRSDLASEAGNVAAIGTVDGR